METKSLNLFKLLDGREIKLFVADDVFQPNATSNLLISAVQNEEVTAGSVLDLGCGQAWLQLPR